MKEREVGKPPAAAEMSEEISSKISSEMLDALSHESWTKEGSKVQVERFEDMLPIEMFSEAFQEARSTAEEAFKIQCANLVRLVMFRRV